MIIKFLISLIITWKDLTTKIFSGGVFNNSSSTEQTHLEKLMIAQQVTRHLCKPAERFDFSSDKATSPYPEPAEFNSHPNFFFNDFINP